MGLHAWPYKHRHSKYPDFQKPATTTAKTQSSGFGKKTTTFYPLYQESNNFEKAIIDRHEQFHQEHGLTDEIGAYSDELKYIDELLEKWNPQGELRESIERERENALNQLRDRGVDVDDCP